MPKKTRGKYKPILLLVFIVIFAILLMTRQLRTGQRPTLLTRPIIYLYRTTHRLVNLAIYRLNGVWEGYLWLVGVKQENAELQAELNRLKEINNRYLEYKLENQRLRRLLEFKEQADIKVVPAQIIGKDPSSWFKTILIDKGTDDGIKKNQVVVTHQGVVGQIIETTPSAAKVLLICDQNSSVAVLVQRNRAEGIMVGGEQELCKINYLSRTADVQPGDTVVTSGLGGIFPKGLIVGKVTQVKKKNYGLFQEIEVRPEVDFSELEEILIIM
jgi:rod shape-determining protein MreC